MCRVSKVVSRYKLKSYLCSSLWPILDAAKVKRRQRGGDERQRHNAGLQRSDWRKKNSLPYGLYGLNGTTCVFLPLDEAVASTAVFVIVSRSDWRKDRRAETLLEPAKQLKNGTS